MLATGLQLFGVGLELGFFFFSFLYVLNNKEAIPFNISCRNCLSFSHIPAPPCKDHLTLSV